MTSGKHKGELCLTCDECGENKYGGTLEWEAFWAEAKAEGWRAVMDRGEWTHTCPECS